MAVECSFGIKIAKKFSTTSFYRRSALNENAFSFYAPLPSFALPRPALSWTIVVLAARSPVRTPRAGALQHKCRGSHTRL
jgi:hypothetical protein